MRINKKIIKKVKCTKIKIKINNKNIIWNL